MRILTWNLNHRARRRAVPDWIAAAILGRQPDVVVLTEYVEGPDHGRLAEALGEAGFAPPAVSARPSGGNQVLVAARGGVERRTIEAPGTLPPAVSSNVLHVGVPSLGIEVLGFRMPAFPSAQREDKRKTWDWLLDSARSLGDRAAVITGDLNTSPEDGPRFFGDRIAALVEDGRWRLARPADGYSWLHARSGRERQIDHLFHTRALTARRAVYDWDFRALNEDAVSGKVGRPDHAMLVVDLDANAAGASA